MPYYYAQVDSDGICYAVTETAGEIERPDMIPIQELDTGLLGKKRIADDWENVTEPPIEPEEPTEPHESIADKLFRLEQQNLILMDALADLYEEILSLKEGGEA